MFTHGFPYTNFHDLNLDWIIKTVKILFNKSVFSINNVEPDDDGNVTITGAELGAVGTINNIAPVEGNVTLTASDVGAVAVGQGVTKVNGFSPNSAGEVLAGTVRSINGISPASLPTPGNVVLNASDVGALPSTIDPVETVNGISPDSNGNVNVGTVKSVNGSTPDAQGNVNLPTVAGVTSVNNIGADEQGNVQLTASDVGALADTVNPVLSINNRTPDSNTGNIAMDYSNVGITKSGLWVDGTNGLDTNDGKTEATAFKTIGKAVSMYRDPTICSRNEINIKAGTYDENIQAYFESNACVTFKAIGGEVIVADLHLYAPGKVRFASQDSGSYGFTFKKLTNTSSSLFEVTNCTMENGCPLHFDCDSDTNLEPFIIRATDMALSWRGGLTMANVAKTYSILADRSTVRFWQATMTSNVMAIQSEHSVILGAGNNITINGTALSI